MAGEPYNWSVTAADNATADATVNWAEGQLPSTVNNSSRALMAGLASLIKDLGGTVTTGGTANAQTATLNVAFSTLATGRMAVVKAGASNTGAATLNVNSIGAKAIKKYTAIGEADIAASDIRSGGIYMLRYDAAANSAAGAWILINPSTSPRAITSTDINLSAGNYTSTVADEVLVLTGSMSTNRTITLPLSTTLYEGWRLRLIDPDLIVSTTNYITVSLNATDAAGSVRLNGSTSWAINSPGVGFEIVWGGDDFSFHAVHSRLQWETEQTFSAGDIPYYQTPVLKSVITSTARGRALIEAESNADQMTALSLTESRSMTRSFSPQAILSLSSSIAIPTTDITAATAIYAHALFGGNIPIVVPGDTDFTSRRIVTPQNYATIALNSTDHPANTTFSIFYVWEQDTVMLATFPWAAASTAPSGVGTAETIIREGILVNRYPLTMRCDAGSVAFEAAEATFAGVFSTTGTGGQTEFTLRPAAAVNGTNNKLLLWNQYNRQPRVATCRDSTDTWAYSTTTIRGANNSASNRVTVVTGDAGIPVKAIYSALCDNGGSGAGKANIGLDSTTAMHAASMTGYTFATTPQSIVASLRAHFGGVGLRYVQALESGIGGASTTNWYGDAGQPNFQTGLVVEMDM
jgi:hypothetical protein